MRKLLGCILAFAVICAAPSLAHTQEDPGWESGFYEKTPEIAPQGVLSPRADFGSSLCTHKVVKEHKVGKVITEKCKRKEGIRAQREVSITRTIAFPKIINKSFVLTLLLEKRTSGGSLISARCWINEEVLALDEDPGSLDLINAIYRLNNSYEPIAGKRRCEKTFKTLPFQ